MVGWDGGCPGKITAVFETTNLPVMASRSGERQSGLGRNFKKALENLVAGRAGCHLDREFSRHQADWNCETLALFKSGESGAIAGDSFELSYSLAEILLEKDRDEFGVGLDDLFQSFLGDVL